MNRSSLPLSYPWLRPLRLLAVPALLGGAVLLLDPYGGSSAAKAQAPPPSESAKVETTSAVSFAESALVSELPPAEAKLPDTGLGGIAAISAEESEIVLELPMFPLPRSENANLTAGVPLQEAASIVAALPGATMPAPLVSFEGQSCQDNFNAFGFRLSPPDTNGDVGPNHYVQMVNLLTRVYDKTGAPLTAPFKLSSLFAPIGGQCAASDQGDVIVLYDPLADRWVLSQFAFAGTSTPPYHECVAVSKTGDPTGAYYLYDFVLPGSEFPDYPKLGVWPDAYYMSTNQFYLGGSFDGTGAFAFDRSKMLAGDPTAGLVYFNMNLAVIPDIGGVLPSDLDGLVTPPTGRPNTFAYFLATEFGDPFDALKLFDFHVDWINPANSTFTQRSESPIAVAAFNPLSPSGRDDILQPPPATNSAALDSISDRLMHRLQYRNTPAGQSLVVTHSVNVTGSTTLGTYRSGIRYYQLTDVGGGFAVTEQATFDPVDGHSRWMGSAATDNSGNLAVGYSVSSLTKFPSIRYAGRLATDPPGGLYQGENELIAGTGVQRDSGSRWGDYSALMVDPADDCTFWYTTEYYTAASQASSTVGWLTRIGSFRFPSCMPPPQGTLAGTVTNANNSAPVNGASIALTDGYFASTSGTGNYSMVMAPGTYTATASKFGYLSASAVVVVAGGGVTIQDFALTPLPVMAASGSSLVAEGFSPSNGAIDPAETVTVNFTLKNIGPGDTINLMATLLPTGGVTNPDGPTTYGVVVGSGGTGTQPFTFTADPSLSCGGQLIATLHLQDGAMDLGNVTYSFNLGAQTVSLMENFDGVVAPALPAGWTATVATGSSGNNWRTAASSADTAPNTAFVPDVASVHDVRLNSLGFTTPVAGAQLSFRNNYATESGYDGGVLEISINGGAFIDILAAGGSFVSGGYNRTLSTGFSNPLPGRQAWSGSSGGYLTSVVNLPAASAGQNVQLRWRFGSDSSVGGTGWRVDTIVVSSAFTCTYDLFAHGSSIVEECYAPANNALDPNEKATVDFALRNLGSASTTNLVATLLATGGVTDPDGPHAYGAIAGAGGIGTQVFSFRVDPGMNCGDQLVATLQLQDGAFDLGTVSYNFTLGVLTVSLSENFDGAVAPAIPAGWTATVASGLSTNNWRTVNTSPDTAPNTAFVPDVASVHDVRLHSPVFAVLGPGGRISFRNNYATESGYDGGVLEISLNGGAFADILTAGGSFIAGGYNRTLSTGFSNPLPGRQAWSGSSGGYITTEVNLPAAAAGQNVQLRWRFGSDSSVASTGWRVDTIVVFGNFVCAINGDPLVGVSPGAQTVQYSDPIAPVSIQADDCSLDVLSISTQWNKDGGTFTAGLPASLSLAENGCSSGLCEWTLSGNMYEGPGTYVLRATIADDEGGSSNADITVVVVQEDARVTYTGALFASTSTTTSNIAYVTLAATVQDVTAVPADPDYDADPGDVRNATVTFVDSDNFDAVLCTASVGLVSMGDTLTGTATCIWTANLGSADSISPRVGIIVGHYYTRDSTADDVIVTVSRPLAANFISGGGYLRLTNSAGLKAGDVGSKNNFGFSVKYTKTGRNLQGSMNTIVRRTETDGLHIYQIKGTAMTSLSTQVSTGKAVFNGKVNIKDITNPAAPFSVDSNATLQVTMDDNGEPGSTDTMGITIWNKDGGLWYASKWDGVKTVEQLLDGGNLVVH
ncbi:MAG: carboxypeptidase regulatory-like domain-containing protein [Planctomycetota bacterium]